MRSTQSIVTSQSIDSGKIEQVTDCSRDAAAYRCARIQGNESVHFIWLDNNIKDHQNRVSQLRRVVDNINTFTESEECVKFINCISGEKACVIIADSFVQHIMSRIHNLSQVYSIFISCSENERREHRTEEWSKEWPKIKGIFIESSDICRALKHTARQYEQNLTPISLVPTAENMFNRKSNRLDCSFMYTEIIKEILLEASYKLDYMKEFIEYCNDQFINDKGRLMNVKEMERTYHHESAILWYSSSSFVHTMLNSALRQLNVDVIIKMGFFINDLHRQIEELHNKQLRDDPDGNIFTVYRGQGLPKADFEQMRKTKNGLISFNSFLSTSKDREISNQFTESNWNDPNLIGILFVMEIDPSKSRTPFACIEGISKYADEQEVLFSMNTVFRIRDIKPMDNSQRLFYVNLTLTSDTDNNLLKLGKRIRQEIGLDCKEWDKLGKLLLKIGMFDKAHELYQVLLDQATNDIEKARIYYHIGCAKKERGEYKSAHTFYGKALETQEQLSSTHSSDLANTYNCIGTTYHRMGEYPKAFSSHQTALAIRQKSLPPNLPDLAKSYNNIGMVHFSMGEYSKALDSYKKALVIRKKSLPLRHPLLASSYNNISMVYSNTGEYSKALFFHEKALAIRQESLPSTHNDFAISNVCIGTTYYFMGKYSKALSFYQKAVAIRERLLQPNHPDLAESYNDIGSVHFNIGEYSKALSFYKKALAIRRISLPSNHPDLATSYNNIGLVYFNTYQYSKAFYSHRTALAIRLKSLPANHSDLAHSYNNIGLLHFSTYEYSNALSFHIKALVIQQQSPALDHLDYASSNVCIGNVYHCVGEYSKALAAHQKALAIRQRFLPLDHPLLTESYNGIKTLQMIKKRNHANDSRRKSNFENYSYF